MLRWELAGSDEIEQVYGAARVQVERACLHYKANRLLRAILGFVGYFPNTRERTRIIYNAGSLISSSFSEGVVYFIGIEFTNIKNRQQLKPELKCK